MKRRNLDGFGWMEEQSQTPRRAFLRCFGAALSASLFSSLPYSIAEAAIADPASSSSAAKPAPADTTTSTTGERIRFEDITRAAGIRFVHNSGAFGKKYLPETMGPGVGFIDYDNDGWKDIFVGNGHVYPQVDQQNWGTSYAQRPLLFHNIDGKKFAVVPAVKGTGLAAVYVARGVAFGDLFNDGKIDAVINQMDGVPVLLRNVTKNDNHWVGFQLVGGPKSPRDAIGSTAYLTAGGVRQRGDVLSGGSFASNNDARLHFGLGGSTKVDALEIHWPDRTTEKIAIPTVDRYFTIQEGKGIVPGVYDPATKQHPHTARHSK